MRGRVISLTLLFSSTDAWVSSRVKQNGFVDNNCRAATTRRAATGKNVVLAPSDDPVAFDSFKIGNARVHRYSREKDPESETEYVMWYHGRSKEQGDPKLPPLSTGRIGRATSRNGLVWEKDTKGSVSEDIKGVSLGLNTAEWWGFDTSHVGLGNVLLPMTTPAVLNEGGVYIMYFMGGDHQEQPISGFVDRELPESMKDATIKGMSMKIGVAVSQDGITWGKVEGDDPSGACVVPYTKQDPNIEKGAVPRNMSEELYCAWPEVVVHANGEKSAGFVMYYSTMLKDTKEKCIARAISADGFRWIKKEVCLKPDTGGLDANGCARCCVIQNAIYSSDAGSWKNSKGWAMFYEGVSEEDGKHRILQATSQDGAKWTKTGVAFDIDSEEDGWDHGGVGSPHIIRMDDGSMRMYYTGQSARGETAIGVAKLTTESGVWERELANFALVA
ncbi:hypothetical protein ACA910_019678 [Epithemia clementina (nom. ined.)]